METSQPRPQSGARRASGLTAKVPSRPSPFLHFSKQSQHRMIYMQASEILRNSKTCDDEKWEKLGRYGFHEVFAYHGVSREQFMWLDRRGLEEIVTPTLEVSTARQEKSNKQLVVLKVSTRLPDANTAMVIRFINNSADQLDGVCHQRLLQCFGVHETESHLHTYLESTCGSMLSELFSAYGKGAFEEDKLTQLINAVVYQTLEGVQFIHSVKKMVHNAITSDTILLTNTGSVKITGFGLCQSFSEYGGTLGPALECYLNAGHSSFWHAPEVIRRESCVYQSDIWSLGCLILELCTRNRPTPWSTNPGIGLDSKSLNIGGLMESMGSSYPIHAKLVSTMVCEEAEKRGDAGGVLRKFKKSGPIPLNPTSTNIHDMITPASDMAKLDTLYASAYVGPPLGDPIAQSFQMS